MISAGSSYIREIFEIVNRIAIYPGTAGTTHTLLMVVKPFSDTTLSNVEKLLSEIDKKV